MDREVVPKPCKICDWMLNSSWEHFGLHQGKKMSRWSWSLRFPKDIFKGPHYLLTWSNKFCAGRGKRGALVDKCKGPCQKNVVIINFWWKIYLWGREYNDKRREWNAQTWVFLFCFLVFWFFFKLPFLDICYKNQHIHILVHGHSSWSTFGLHLVRGPKAL